VIYRYLQLAKYTNIQSYWSLQVVHVPQTLLYPHPFSGLERGLQFDNLYTGKLV
jgi:hypothetical protein